MQTETTHTEPTTDELLAVVIEAETATARSAKATEPRKSGKPPSTKEAPRRSKKREAATTVIGVAGGEAARRAIVDAVDRKKVIEVACRVATKKTAGMTDAQVMQFVIENDGFRKSLAGHLHEQLDAEDLKHIYELRKTLRMSEGRFLKLYAEHNRKGLDGAYKGALKKGDALFAQHKASANPNQVRKAADKVGKSVRGKTEVVVPRGVKKNLKASDVKGLKGVRESGRSLKTLNGMVERAADPKKLTDAGTKAAGRLTLKAGAGAAAFGAGLSIACDANKVRKGEMTKAQAAENAAWAGGEAALCTAATAGVTMAAAPTLAAGTAALAASTAAGTTAMAAGLATLGPVGLGIGVGIGIGFGVKKVRQRVRAS